LDFESRETLTRLIDTQRVAALSTLRDGAPFVSLVPFVVVPDATVSFYIHISRLAQHTQDILADPRVALMIAETDGGAGDPQRLARVCIEGMAAEIAPQDPGYAPARSRYLARFPDAAFNFNLPISPSFGSCPDVPATLRDSGGYSI
jgi:heme iron utilization protein